jgi:hypothetical protein
VEADEIRNRTVEIARKMAGLNANPKQPESRRRYVEVIAPGEPDAKAKEMATMSGCGLMVAGIWREAGVNATLLDPPYKVGSGVSRLIQIARATKAWVPFKKGARPQPGDMVLVGDNGAGGVEHVYTIVAVNDGPEGLEIESVDGGQRDAERCQLVLLKKRVWKGNRDCVRSGSDPGAALAGGRVIQGWVDVTLLPFT